MASWRGDCRERSGGDEFVAKRLEGWIVSRRDHGSHEERGADAGSSAADETFASPLTGLAGPRGQPHESGDFAPVEFSEFGQFSEQRAGDGGSNPRHGGEQVFFFSPSARSSYGVVDIAIEAVEFAL